jgi:hypothetical protein
VQRGRWSGRVKQAQYGQGDDDVSQHYHFDGECEDKFDDRKFHERCENVGEE